MFDILHFRLSAIYGGTYMLSKPFEGKDTVLTLYMYLMFDF